jgi:hypothetical protein
LFEPWVVKLLPLNKEDIRFVRFLVGPEVAEHFLLVTETRHPVLSGLRYVRILIQNNSTQREKTALVRFDFVEKEIVVGHRKVNVQAQKLHRGNDPINDPGVYFQDRFVGGACADLIVTGPGSSLYSSFHHATPTLTAGCRCDPYRGLCVGLW